MFGYAESIEEANEWIDEYVGFLAHECMDNMVNCVHPELFNCQFGFI